jgi:hypothetical protein
LITTRSGNSPKDLQLARQPITHAQSEQAGQGG